MASRSEATSAQENAFHTALHKLCKGWTCLSNQYARAYERYPATTIVSTTAAALVGGTCAVNSILRSYKRSQGPNRYQKPFTLPNSETFTPTGYGDHSPVSVQRVPETRKDIKEAAKVFAGWLTRSNDPITRACAAKDLNPQQFEGAVQWLFSVLLKETVPVETGCITLEDSKRKAVAVWIPPGYELDEWEFLKSGGYAFLWRFSGWERRMRYLGFGEIVKTRRWRLMKPYQQNYYYLLALGTSEEHLDNPNSAAVVEAVLKQADEAGVPCAVETSKQEAVSFYSRFGFETVEEFSCFGITVYMLIRNPRSNY
eukprot:gb/GECG01008555.1/.p1 GENE.gb/GECG01008555.1/~~gb/GECG01008555.1/.p1  ORF type:complete len:313 (+),score=23.04 gb/GECG01008555.1/:1-939(+)